MKILNGSIDPQNTKVTKMVVLDRSFRPRTVAGRTHVSNKPTATTFQHGLPEDMVIVVDHNPGQNPECKAYQIPQGPFRGQRLMLEICQNVDRLEYLLKLPIENPRLYSFLMSSSESELCLPEGEGWDGHYTDGEFRRAMIARQLFYFLNEADLDEVERTALVSPTDFLADIVSRGNRTEVEPVITHHPVPVMEEGLLPYAHPRDRYFGFDREQCWREMKAGEDTTGVQTLYQLTFDAYVGPEGEPYGMSVRVRGQYDGINLIR